MPLTTYVAFGWHQTYIKPRPNGLASRCKLKTWVYLRFRLARSCVHLRRLALTLAAIKFARKLTQVFQRLATQLSMQVEWRPFSYYTPMKYRISLPWNNSFFRDFVYQRGNLRVRLATQRKSLRKFNLRLLATPCESVWPGLKSSSWQPWFVDRIMMSRCCILNCS